MSLRVENLSVAYRSHQGDVTAVDGVSFSVADGEIMGLAGESGCGKSTLGNALVYMDPRMKLVSGRALVDGAELPIADSGAMRRLRMAEVSLVPQYAMSALPETRRIGTIAADLLKSHGVADRTGVMAEMRRRIELVGLKGEILRGGRPARDECVALDGRAKGHDLAGEQVLQLVDRVRLQSRGGRCD